MENSLSLKVKIVLVCSELTYDLDLLKNLTVAMGGFDIIPWYILYTFARDNFWFEGKPDGINEKMECH